MLGRGLACRVERRRATHLFVRLLACYLTLDFADPSMPGALNFNVDLNTDAVLTNIPSKQDEPMQRMLALPACVVPVVDQLKMILLPSPLAPRWAVPGWLVKLRQSRTPGSETSPTTEDD
jgi:hypothetical protein